MMGHTVLTSFFSIIWQDDSDDFGFDDALDYDSGGDCSSSSNHCASSSSFSDLESLVSFTTCNEMINLQVLLQKNNENNNNNNNNSNNNSAQQQQQAKAKK